MELANISLFEIITNLVIIYAEVKNERIFYKKQWKN